MEDKDIHEVGKRLEAAVYPQISESMSPMEIYELYEQTAIQILDSEFDNWFGDDLQIYLESYLEGVEKRLGVDLNFD